MSLTQIDAGEFSSSEMRLPGDITFRMSGQLSSDPPGDLWEFVPFAPVTGGARQWRNITRYIDRLLADPAAVAAPLVQLAFRRHLDVTPAGCLRRVRLDQAHRQLQAADPEHDSVTAVAYR